MEKRNHCRDILRRDNAILFGFKRNNFGSIEKGGLGRNEMKGNNINW